MTDVQHWIDRCRSSLNRGAVLKVMAEWLAVWLCAFGTLLLVIKVAWPALWPHVLWLGVSVVPVAAWSIRRSLRHGFTATDGAALLDRRLNARGLLMAVAEKPNGAWRQHLPQEEAVWTAAMPKLRPVRFARIVALPLVFAVVAILLPARQTPTSAAVAGRSLPAVQELPEMLAELKAAGVLDSDEAGFLQDEIDKLVESTAKSPPTPESWRKIDALRARLNDRLDREARTVEKGRRAARKLAQAGRNGNPPLSNEQRRQLEKDLADALKRSKQAKAAAASKNPQPAATVAKTDAKTRPQPETRKTPTKSVAAQSPPETSQTSREPSKVPGIAERKSPAQSAGGKTPAAKVAAAKTPNGGVSQGKGSAATKTLIAKLPKQPPQAGKQELRPSGKNHPAFDPSRLRDLAKLAKMVESLPPELQEKLKQEVMRMIQSGQLRIPDDPALREMLVKQAQQLLEQDGRRLDELRKRFGHLAGRFEDFKNPELRQRNPSPTAPAHSSSAATQNGGTNPEGVPGKQPRAVATTKPPGSVSFRDVVLPPGLLDKPRNDPDSVSGKRPAVTPFRPTVPVGSKSANDPAGEKWRALRRKVRPRNRNLVYRYFYGKDGN